MENISELVSVKYPCVTLSPRRLCALAVLLCLKSPYHVDLTPYRAPINQNMANIARFYSKPMKASLTQLPPDRWNPASLGREVNLTLHSLQPHPTPRLRWGQHGAPAHERDADARNSLAWTGKLLSPARIYREERSGLIHGSKPCCGRKTRFHLEGLIAAPKIGGHTHVVPRGILLSPICLSASPLSFTGSLCLLPASISLTVLSLSLGTGILLSWDQLDFLFSVQVQPEHAAIQMPSSEAVSWTFL